MPQTEDLLVELRTMQSDERLPAEVRDRVRQIAGRIEHDLETLYARIRELDELVVTLAHDGDQETWCSHCACSSCYEKQNANEEV